MEKDNRILMLNRFGRRVKKVIAFTSAMNRKQLPLCSIHHIEFKNGIFSKLYASFFNSIYNTKISESDVFCQVFMTVEFEKNQRK